MDPISHLIERIPDLAVCRDAIEQAAALLTHTYEAGGKVLVCGNGGSAADSEHIVAELMKGFMLRRSVPDAVRSDLLASWPEEGEYLAGKLQGALPAISLVSQTALISAFSNDVAADMIFAQQVYGYGRSGDALIALSTSGNSANVVNAVKVARVVGLRTIGLTNSDGGKLAQVCDVCIKAPRKITPEVQELHIAVYHALCALLEEKFFS